MRKALIPLLLLATPATAQTGATPDESERAALAAKRASEAAREYEIVREAGGGGPLKLEPEPLLHWSNPVAGSIHGTVFVWTDGGRPEMIGSMAQWFGPKFFHRNAEFQSLATTALSARVGGRVVWAPRSPGIAPAAIPGAPAPADTPAARLRQLRALAREFAADETAEGGVNRTLRLLTQPVFRYSGGDAVDGALFAFVEGTDPEVILLIEARRRPGGALGWDYAPARLTTRALRVTHGGKEVWSTPQLPWPAALGHAETYTVFISKPPQP